MNQSVEIAKISKALHSAKAEFGTITKNKTATVRSQKGAGYSYSYADMGEILGALVPALRKHGIEILQPLGLTLSDVPTVKTIFLHVSGEWIGGETPIPIQTEMQKWGAWVSYARRFGVVSLAGVVADDEAEKMEGHEQDVFSPAPTSPSAPPSTPQGGAEEDVAAEIARLAVRIAEKTNEAPSDVILAASSFSGEGGKKVGFTHPAGKSEKWQRSTLAKLKKRLGDLALAGPVEDVPF